MSYSLLDGVRRALHSRSATSALFLPLLFLAGCGSGGSDGGGGGNPPVGTGTLVDQPGWTVRSQTRALAPKKWTVLVYMNAANDLEKFGSLNMNQMEQIG